MPVRQISDHCLQVRRFNVMNCYLIREHDGLTVVDTAMGSARILKAAAGQLGQPIRRILLTHAHTDHVGSVDALMKIFPDAELIAGERESLLLSEAARSVKTSRMTLLPGEAQKPVKGSFKKVECVPTRLVNENDSVGSLRVISTPGHTPGHLSFFDERDKSLYAGDSLATFGSVSLPFDTVWYFPFPKFATWDAATALASARRLALLGARWILAGHGPAVDEARPKLAEAITHAEHQVTL